MNLAKNGPKYVSNVTLCDARVAPYPLQGVLSPFPALQFAGRALGSNIVYPGPRILLSGHEVCF
jgi:hypothetical protein